MDLLRNSKHERSRTLRPTYDQRLSYGGDSDGQLLWPIPWEHFRRADLAQSGHAASRKLFSAVMSAGSIIIVSIAIDLTTSVLVPSMS
jgi:hypothetical protein